MLGNSHFGQAVSLTPFAILATLVMLSSAPQGRISWSFPVLSQLIYMPLTGVLTLHSI